LTIFSWAFSFAFGSIQSRESIISPNDSMTNFVCNSMSSRTASSNCQNSHKSLYLFLHFIPHLFRQFPSHKHIRPQMAYDQSECPHNPDQNHPPPLSQNSKRMLKISRKILSSFLFNIFCALHLLLLLGPFSFRPLVLAPMDIF
jgi:hypothetical protein